MNCSSCGAPYHEASGHRFSERVAICGPCTLHYIEFLKSHQKRKWGGLRFYEHAATSIRAKDQT
jgi:hypothetical protein